MLIGQRQFSQYWRRCKRSYIEGKIILKIPIAELLSIFHLSHVKRCLRNVRDFYVVVTAYYNG